MFFLNTRLLFRTLEKKGKIILIISIMFICSSIGLQNGIKVLHIKSETLNCRDINEGKCLIIVTVHLMARILKNISRSKRSAKAKKLMLTTSFYVFCFMIEV